MNPQPKPIRSAKEPKRLTRSTPLKKGKKKPICKNCGHKEKLHENRKDYGYDRCHGCESLCVYQPAIGKKQKRKTPEKILREKPLRKHSKNPLPKLRKKVWAAVSAYVKERDGYHCITCGKGPLEGSNRQAGHCFASGNNSALRYHPKNLGVQDYYCNVQLRGNAAVYAAKLIDRYGVEEFLTLNDHAKDEKKWSRAELEEMLTVLARGGAEFEMWYFERYPLVRTTAGDPVGDTSV